MERRPPNLHRAKIRRSPCESISDRWQDYTGVGGRRASFRREVETLRRVDTLWIGRVRFRHMREHIVIHQNAVLFLSGRLAIILQTSEAAFGRRLTESR